MRTSTPSLTHPPDSNNDGTWITHELADSQFGDKRLNKRFELVVASLWGAVGKFSRPSVPNGARSVKRIIPTRTITHAPKLVKGQNYLVSTFSDFFMG